MLSWTCLLLTLPMVNTFGANDGVEHPNHSQLNSSLALKGRLWNGQGILRWTPSDYETWRKGIEEGYKVILRKYDADGALVYFHVSDPIFPVPEGQWGDLSTNETLGLAHALLYNIDESIYQGAQGAYTRKEDEENRYGFALFTADMNIQVATHLGLAYVDTLASMAEINEYQVVTSDGTITSLPIQLNTSETESLPQPQSLNANFGDGEVLLTWLKGNLPEYYSSYAIEYSTDGGATFTKMNSRPFVNLESEEQSAEELAHIYYRAPIDNDIAEYQFRVQGRSPFGEMGPFSEIASGQGQPDPLPLLPLITEVTELPDSSFRLEWLVDENYADSISHFNVWHYETFPGEHTVINQSGIDATARIYTHLEPDDMQYYRVEAVDIYGGSSYSPVALAERIDSIPPAPPTGLVGQVDTILDTITIIRITWNPNTEADLGGYHVYRSNGPNNEFSILTNSGILTDTTYLDTIYTMAAGDLVYYKLRAHDFRGNRSEFSEMLSVERPDLMPPVPPVFGSDPSKSADGLSLTWINSTSHDVVSHQLQRKVIGSQEDWEIVEEKSQSQKKKESFVDPNTDAEYWYRIVVTDDAGLQSISDTLSVKFTPMEKSYRPPRSFDLVTQKQDDLVLVKWLNTDLDEVDNFVVYRKANDGPILSIARISVEELVAVIESGQSYFTFEDKYCEEGNSYSYWIQACYKSGRTSNVSENQVVNF